MNDLRTAAQQALEYMKSVGQADMHPEEWAIVERLEAALAQQAEPVQDQRCRAEPRSDGDFVCDCKIGECLGRSAALARQVKTCAWRDNLDAIYETECGNLHIVADGTLEENGMKYCCYCGKEIKDESPT